MSPHAIAFAAARATLSRPWPSAWAATRVACIAYAITSCRFRDVMPAPGDLVLWRFRTTVVRVEGTRDGLVWTAGRPGVSAVAEKPDKIRFWIRRA